MSYDKRSKWVHRDEYDNQKALYEIRVNALLDEIEHLKHQLDTLQDNGHTADEYIEDAEIVED